MFNLCELQIVTPTGKTVNLGQIQDTKIENIQNKIKYCFTIIDQEINPEEWNNVLEGVNTYESEQPDV